MVNNRWFEGDGRWCVCAMVEGLIQWYDSAMKLTMVDGAILRCWDGAIAMVKVRWRRFNNDCRWCVGDMAIVDGLLAILQC